MKTTSFIHFLVLLNCTVSLGQENWHKGYYFDLQGNRIEGFIEYEHDCKPTFYFKNQLGEKQKLRAWEVKSFVVENDSFRVIKDFEMAGGQRNPYDFVKVVKTGAIVLLRNCSIIPGGTSNSGGMTRGYKLETYILTKPNSDKLWTVYSMRKLFLRTVTDITQHLPESSRFKDPEKITYEMIPDLIQEYNDLKAGAGE